MLHNYQILNLLLNLTFFRIIVDRKIDYFSFSIVSRNDFRNLRINSFHTFQPVCKFIALWSQEEIRLFIKEMEVSHISRF